jgi:hypothetical protein
MADRIVLGTIKNEEDDILFLTNESESWSPISVDQVIEDIENDTHKYYSQSFDNPILVINDRHKGKYVRAKQNSYLADNLDNLREFRTPEFIGNHPSNKKTNYSNSLQGVTHNENQWFFTQKKKIHRLDIFLDSQNFEITPMPQNLVDLGYNHFGDPEYIHYNNNGYLLIPVENGDLGSILCAFRDDIQNNRLIYIGFSILHKQTEALNTNRAGWVAFNPINRLLYSSFNRINRQKPVFRYAIDFTEMENGNVVLTPSTDLQLTEQGREHKIARYMQGGCFSPNGLLYLAHGKLASSVKQGISVFDIQGNFLFSSKRHKSQGTFHYEVHPNFYRYQEVEGITYWNLDGPINGQNSHKIRGQLHAILLNKGLRTDKYWFKHFRTEF